MCECLGNFSEVFKLFILFTFHFVRCLKQWQSVENRAEQAEIKQHTKMSKETLQEVL